MTGFPRLRVLALACLTIAVACMAADAQPPGRGRGEGGRGAGGFGGRGPGMMGQFAGRGGGGLVGLLQIREVRKEINITDEQIGKLTRLREDTEAGRRDRGSSFQGFGDLSDSEREARMREFREQMEKRNKEMETKISAILSREQFKRLKQIELQQQGTAALIRPDIGQALGITDAQRQQIQAAGEEIREKMRDVFANARNMSEDERAGLREKIQQMNSQREKKVMAVLTADQKAKLKEIMGEPFDMPRPEFGRGGPGGGRGGFDRGGGGDRGRPRGGDRGGDRRRRPQA